MPPHARRQTPAQRKHYERALGNLKDITAPHIQAFDYAITEGFAGLHLCAQEFQVKALNSQAPSKGHKLRIWFENVSLGAPLVDGKPLFPRECRERGLDYSAEMQADFVYQLDERPSVAQRVSLGQAPIMVMSKKCRLANLSPDKLVDKGEDAAELGGYFIASGNERLLRYFQLPKRNVPQAIIRGSNRKFGEGFTDFAVAMRCVRAADQQSSTLTIHYSRDGTVYCRIRYRKIEYFIPLGLMLKALVPSNEMTDEELYQRIARGDEFIASRIELELRKASDRGWKKTKDALEFLGAQFKDRLADACALNASNEEVGQTFLDLLIFIHVEDAHGKLECLVEMARKLYAAVQGSCGADDPDAFDSHELLLGGHLYLQSAKEMIEDTLGVIRKDVEVTMAKKVFELAPFLTQLSSRLLVLAQRYGNVGRKLFSILATGSIAFSKTGLDMAQVGGFSIIADKLNRLRYLAHFHSVHRGTFFAEMKTTMGRKLLPQAWGFLCPVHTPDGAPCGLLNHMAQLAGVVALPQLSPSASEAHLKDLCLLLASWGMLPSRSVGGSALVPPGHYLPILFDGRVLGHASEDACKFIADQLHYWKAKLLRSLLERNFADWLQEKSLAYFPTARVIARVSLERDLCSKSLDREQRAICPTMEVAMISKVSTSNTSTYPYPGLFLSTGQARMVRPVIQLKTGWVELIGPLEQVFLKIAVARNEIDSEKDGYVELDVASSMLSVIASMTPFSDFNQSPRNMYQCASWDHDVLTRNGGWRALPKVQVGEDVLTFNPSTGKQEWQAVTAVINEPHASGVFYRLQSASMDAVVTGEHRWLLNSKAAPNTWEYFTTEEAIKGKLPQRSNGGLQWENGKVHSNCSLPLVGTNPNPAYQFAECASFLSSKFRSSPSNGLDFCRLIGLVLAEGSMEQAGAMVTIAGSTYTDDLLARLQSADPVAFAHTIRKDCNYRLHSKDLHDFFKPMMVGAVGFDPSNSAALQQYDHSEAYRRVQSGLAVECTPSSRSAEGEWQKARRWLHYAWRMHLSRDQARALLEGFVMAQASDAAEAQLIRPGCELRAVHPSLPLINDLSTLALLAEARPKLALANGKRGAAQAWSLTLSFKEQELMTALPKPVAYVHPKPDGRKYCLSVPNGNFLARRQSRFGADHQVMEMNQAPFFTGNCQMGKQTMGTPCHSFPQRADNKLYRLQNVQYPLVKTQAQDTYMIDEYPNGCNAVVCVISYTGYDMDDAMIINKSSMERGFGHASVYTTVDLEVDAQSEEWISNRDLKYSTLDADGLPQIGTRLKEGDYLCSIWNNVSQRYRVEKFKDSEPAVVLRVKLMEPNTSARSGKSFKKSKDNEGGGVRKASITLRYDRNPTIGDKFSSRHGQKGVLSVLWPQQDMPFSESGMTPDVIINPHAFPSRMTIGMLVESLAGKAGALHGKSSMDATPFTMQGDDPGKMANDYFGSQLLDAGYSYYGSEPMYSGVFGAEMHCDIYIGVVYYQRLRHMVLDKSQVRATGPVDVITRQPIKGRKRHGGVRFGEMERDSLIAHGTAFLCEDRLLNCSDRHTAHVCCGSILSSYSLSGAAGGGAVDRNKVHCRMCGRGDQWKLITVPYAFRYLTNELAGMGIRLEFKVDA